MDEREDAAEPTVCVAGLSGPRCAPGTNGGAHNGLFYPLYNGKGQR